MNKKISCYFSYLSACLLVAFFILGACAIPPKPPQAKKLKPENPKPIVKKSLALPEDVKELIVLCQKSVKVTVPVAISGASVAPPPPSMTTTHTTHNTDRNKASTTPSHTQISPCLQINFQVLSFELKNLQDVLQKTLEKTEITSHKDISETLVFIKSFYFLVQKIIFKLATPLEESSQKQFTQNIFFKLEKKSYNQILHSINNKNKHFYSQLKNTIFILNQELEKSFKATHYNIDINPLQQRRFSHDDNLSGFLTTQTISQNRKHFEMEFQSVALNLLSCLEIGKTLKAQAQSIKDNILQKQNLCKAPLHNQYESYDKCKKLSNKIIEDTNTLKKDIVKVKLDCYDFGLVFHLS